MKMSFFFSASVLVLALPGLVAANETAKPKNPWKIDRTTYNKPNQWKGVADGPYTHIAYDPKEVMGKQFEYMVHGDQNKAQALVNALSDPAAKLGVQTLTQTHSTDQLVENIRKTLKDKNIQVSSPDYVGSKGLGFNLNSQSSKKDILSLAEMIVEYQRSSDPRYQPALRVGEVNLVNDFLKAVSGTDDPKKWASNEQLQNILKQTTALKERREFSYAMARDMTYDLDFDSQNMKAFSKYVLDMPNYSYDTSSSHSRDIRMKITEKLDALNERQVAEFLQKYNRYSAALEKLKWKGPYDKSGPTFRTSFQDKIKEAWDKTPLNRELPLKPTGKLAIDTIERMQTPAPFERKQIPARFNKKYVVGAAVVGIGASVAGTASAAEDAEAVSAQAPSKTANLNAQRSLLNRSSDSGQSNGAR